MQQEGCNLRGLLEGVRLDNLMEYLIDEFIEFDSGRKNKV